RHAAPARQRRLDRGDQGRRRQPRPRQDQAARRRRRRLRGGTIRQLVTRWFSTLGDLVAMRIESTPSNDAIGLAIREDREGKLIIAGIRQQPKTDANAWVFAVPGP